MGTPLPALRKQALDKDLKKLGALAAIGRQSGLRLLPVGVCAVFLAVAWMIAAGQEAEPTGIVVTAAVIGGYMALNIGANDVANNMAPAVGARALTMGGALLVAAVFEAAGALLAGADVVRTVSRGIIAPSAVADGRSFVALMMAALLGAALWLNLATWIQAPVSTTHSIVGGILGAGVAAAGLQAANWPMLATIAASWVVSPALGGLVAALFLAMLNLLILQADDRIAAARRWVPLVVALTAAAFTAYLLRKGLSQVIDPPPLAVAALIAGAFTAGYMVTRRMAARHVAEDESPKKAVGRLFTAPLIVAAALLSFAHGANDVANAIGPLAAVVGALGPGGVAGGPVAVPGWIMTIGALGIAIGLALFGPRLIRMVGEKITRLNPVRAFCVALSAAVTVLAASALGLPVSSTHIAIGAVFGVGLARERHARRGGHIRRQARLNRERRTAEAAGAVDRILGEAPAGPEMEDDAAPGERARKAARRRLVRRRHLLTIAAAWLVTVPLSALLSAVLFAIMIRLVPGA